MLISAVVVAAVNDWVSYVANIIVIDIIIIAVN